MTKKKPKHIHKRQPGEQKSRGYVDCPYVPSFCKEKAEHKDLCSPPDNPRYTGHG